MKKLILLFLSGLLIAACNQNPEHSTMSGKDSEVVQTDVVIRDGVFIHITESYNDPHRVLMPLKMATIMSADKDVLVYMDIHAVELLVKGAEDLNFEGFESAHTYIKQLTDNNVGIYACPTCLKIAGFIPEDLMDGIQVAMKDKFFSFTKGRIITLDY
jgi:predicted peroxiredoxin